MRIAKFLSYSIIFIVTSYMGTETYTFAADYQTKVPPPNTPSLINMEGETLHLEYYGQVLFNAEFNYMNPNVQHCQIFDEQEGKINQVYKWVANGQLLELTGVIDASAQSFPCEADASCDSKSIVRHSVGLSNSFLNRAVYDRENDWVLSVDRPAQVRIIPLSENENYHQFKIEISGNQISLRFRPHYYQKHRGLSYFDPWNYDVWKPSVAVWCSWFAYFKDISENKIKHTADVISQELVPYGLNYLQIDDGYQLEPEGLPSRWLNGNEKFPSGLDNLCKYIHSKGLKPGIWTHTGFYRKEFAFENKDLFVKNQEGNPAYVCML